MLYQTSFWRDAFIRQNEIPIFIIPIGSAIIKRGTVVGGTMVLCNSSNLCYFILHFTESPVDMFRKVSYHKLVIADHSAYSHVTYARATPEKVRGHEP